MAARPNFVQLPQLPQNAADEYQFDVLCARNRAGHIHKWRELAGDAKSHYGPRALGTGWWKLQGIDLVEENLTRFVHDMYRGMQLYWRASGGGRGAPVQPLPLRIIAVSVRTPPNFDESWYEIPSQSTTTKRSPGHVCAVKAWTKNDLKAALSSGRVILVLLASESVKSAWDRWASDFGDYCGDTCLLTIGHVSQNSDKEDDSRRRVGSLVEAVEDALHNTRRAELRRTGAVASLTTSHQGTTMIIDKKNNYAGAGFNGCERCLSHDDDTRDNKLAAGYAAADGTERSPGVSRRAVFISLSAVFGVAGAAAVIYTAIRVRKRRRRASGCSSSSDFEDDLSAIDDDIHDSARRSVGLQYRY